MKTITRIILVLQTVMPLPTFPLPVDYIENYVEKTARNLSNFV